MSSTKITPEEAAAVLRASECLHDEAAVEAALERMAQAISARFHHRMPIMLTVMVGGQIPAGRLLNKLHFPLEMDYCHATRYRGATSGGDLIWLARPQLDLTDRVVIVIDDILDEGHTLAQIVEDVRFQGAKEVYTAVLANKIHDRRYKDMKADFVGLNVDDRYVFGVGMDYKGYWRNLPAIYAAPET